MKFAEQLQIIGSQIVCEPPPECLAMIARARQDGIAVRHLYVLNEPLAPFRGGRATWRPAISGSS